MNVPAMHVIKALLIGALCAATPLRFATGAEIGPWGYALGQMRAAQQASFCDTREAALEVAQVFERFGARTGFSALSSAPDCSRRVLGLTPRALVHQVRIATEAAGSYIVNFIEVDADDGSRPVLVTTRVFDDSRK